MGDILAIIILGLAIGLVARMLHPGKDSMGIIPTIILGVAGSSFAMLGVPIGLYKKGDILSYVASVLLAIVLLMIYGQIKLRSQNSGNSGNNTPTV
jgi:uncharacterized membrane protein YeaQ/YmgE (transglycosylase-associated protein family)